MNEEIVKKDVAALAKLFNIKVENSHKKDSSDCLQKIYFGPPGTGKSHEISTHTSGQNVIRTTFHPDYDYSNFVGSYKPVMEEQCLKVIPVVATNDVSLNDTKDFKENQIVYKYVKQAFLKAYLSAWKKYSEKAKSKPPEKQYLVIEEINRGNCAQIFGDIFQLLDRTDEGFSCYPIDADSDIQKAIKDAFNGKDDEKKYIINKTLDISDSFPNYQSNYGSHSISEDVQQGNVLLLPPNLFIWATMNTSDQSLFPMDSAFKRRFNWEYKKIDYEEQEAKFNIEIGDEHFSWLEFLEAVNDDIFITNDSDDKQMGEFFIKKTQEKNVPFKSFRDKVLYYLWDAVYKDEGDNGKTQNVFHFIPEHLKTSKNGKKELTFQLLCKQDEKDQYEIVKEILKKLGVKTEKNDTGASKPEPKNKTILNQRKAKK